MIVPYFVSTLSPVTVRAIMCDNVCATSCNVRLQKHTLSFALVALQHLELDARSAKYLFFPDFIWIWRWPGSWGLEIFPCDDRQNPHPWSWFLIWPFRITYFSRQTYQISNLGCKCHKLKPTLKTKPFKICTNACFVYKSNEPALTTESCISAGGFYS